MSEALFERRFSSNSDVLTHLFGTKGVELAIVKDAIFTSNIPLLTDIVCHILDRPNYPDHLSDLEPGTRIAEQSTIDYLGINRGRCEVDHRYNLVHNMLMQCRHPELFDFVRILRSRSDWTSSEFREALETSPLHDFQREMEEDLASISSSRRSFFVFGRLQALTFQQEDINLWLTTSNQETTSEVIAPHLTEETFTTIIQKIFTDFLRNAIGGVNIDFFRVLLDSKHSIITWHGKRRPETEVCSVPYAIRHNFVSYDSFSVAYVSYYCNDVEEKELDEEYANAETTDERKKQITLIKRSYNTLRGRYRELFHYLLDRLGLDLAQPYEIAVVYFVAKHYNDVDVLTKLQALGVNDDNYLYYSHKEHRKSQYIKDATYLAGIDKLSTEHTKEQRLAAIGESLLRRNLLDPFTALMQLTGMTVNEIAGDNFFMTMVATTAVSNPSTVKYLLKHKARLPTNSKKNIRNNMFICCLFGLGSDESRLKMIQLAHDYVKGKPVYKPRVTPLEFTELVGVSWNGSNWRIGQGMRVELLMELFNRVVHKDEWDAFLSQPKQVIQYFLQAFDFKVLNRTPPSLLSEEHLAYFHSQVFHMVQLFFPPHVLAQCNDIPLFRRVVQLAILVRSPEIYRYLMSHGYTPVFEDILFLSQMTSTYYDLNDLIEIPNPLELDARIFRVKPSILSSIAQNMEHILDLDYCDPELFELTRGLNVFDVSTLPSGLLEKVKGSAKAKGIREIDFHYFTSDELVIGGELIGDSNLREMDVSGGESPEDYYENLQYIRDVLNYNLTLPRKERSFFLECFQILMEIAGGDFDDLLLDGSLNVFPYYSCNALLLSIVRIIFPDRPVDLSLFAQIYIGMPGCANINRRVWQDDIVQEVVYEIIGATDYEFLLSDESSDPETYVNYQFNEMGEQLLTSAMVTAWVSHFAMISNHKASQPGKPVPSHLRLDSLRALLPFFHRLRWVPQLMLKMFLVLTDVSDSAIYCDLFDIFLHYGGKFIDPKIVSRAPPSTYVLFIPEEFQNMKLEYLFDKLLQINNLNKDDIYEEMHKHRGSIFGEDDDDDDKAKQDNSNRPRDGSSSQPSTSAGSTSNHSGAIKSESTSLVADANNEAVTMDNKFSTIAFLLGGVTVVAGLAGYFFYSNAKKRE